MPKFNYNKSMSFSPGVISKGDYIIVDDFKYPIEARLQNPEIPQTNLIISKSTLGDDTDIQEMELDEYIKEDYNIFSGLKVNVKESEHKKIIYELMSELNDIVIQFIKAGYHLYTDKEKEEVYNRARIDDWIINFEYPILKMFKLYYGIETSCEDIMFADEFLDNPQFRYMITLTLMKLIANFAVNNLDSVDISNDYNSIEYYYEVKELFNF